MSESVSDSRTSTQWAMATVKSLGGAGLSRVVFDLVNLRTVRAHRLYLVAGGMDAGPPFSYSPEMSMSDYTRFTTYRPVTFDDFDKVGGRVISGNAMIWSYTSLTLWDGPSYFGKGLAWVRMTGWGIGVPGAGIDHGVAWVSYGDGQPLGDPLEGIEMVPDDDVPSSPEDLDVNVKVTGNDDSFKIILQGDVLFDTDRSEIKAPAVKPLKQAAGIIRSARRASSKVLINGHTDDVGDDNYNQGLSERRAKAVADWFIAGKYLPASILRTQGFGKKQPLIPKTDPASRAKNRRVEIILVS